MKQEIIFHNLVAFNGLMLTKRQWEIILKGCGCPKSHRFWRALRNRVLHRIQNSLYMLHISSVSEIEEAWDEYCIDNRLSVKAAYYKKKESSNSWGFGQVCVYNNCIFK